MTAAAPPSDGTPASYPVHVSADPVADRPSSWLWLVKWLLVIPHGLVLMLLWPAFLLLTVVAFFAILVTGRYPRAIFDFNVGVLRWTWRVGYYAYGVLGTDRYPPFTLRDDPGYPAHLEVEYPQRLSRGLVLVKWWLLVLPHYLVVAVLTGAGARAARETAGVEWAWEGGLVALLAVIAGVILLFAGRYPQGLYDLLLGLNRWVLRVAGYAALMTDAYPPFRLDQGGSGAPAALAGDRLRTTPAVPPSPWSAGRTVAVVAGALAVVTGLGLATGGLVLQTWREDGYLTSPTRTVQTDGYAVATESLELRGVGLEQGVGEIRVRAEALDGRELFLGIAEAEDAAVYLAGVDHTVLTGRLMGGDRHVPGDAPRTPPEEADIWLGSAIGPGRQAVEVTAEPGDWVVVAMPADGPGLVATADVGVTLPWFPQATTTAIVLGLLLLLSGAAAMAVALNSTRGPE